MKPNPSSSGRTKSRFTPCGTPLMSNVRPHNTTFRASGNRLTGKHRKRSQVQLIGRYVARERCR